MKKLFNFTLAALACFSICSCNSSSSSSDSKYVSVQLEDSKMWSLLDVSNGQIVMADEFFAPSSNVVNGSFFVENDNKEFDLYNLKDTKNKLNRSSYSVVSNFNKDGFAITRVKDEPWQIINTEGTTTATLDKNLTVVSGFSDDGLALIMNQDNMFGYVNTQGQNPIKPRYTYATIFSDGVAFVLTKQEENHNYFSAIDVTGNTLFTFSDAKYASIGLFNDGHVFAVEGDHCVLLDKTGKKLMNVCNGTNISNLSYRDGKIIYYDGEFYGLKDTEDKILIRAKYQSLRFQSDGNLVALNNNDKFGVINDKDEIITPFDYDTLEYLAPDRYLTNSGNVIVLINGEGKEICEKAFTSFSNRSSSTSEDALATLISADTNQASSTWDNEADFSSGFIMDLLDLGDWEMPDWGNSEGPIAPGEYMGMVDDKYPIVMDVKSCTNSDISGNVYYPSSVEKYGKTPETLMPFTGTITGNNILMFVRSNSDASYSETWDMYFGDAGMSGNILTNTGKSMEVFFNFGW